MDTVKILHYNIKQNNSRIFLIDDNIKMCSPIRKKLFFVKNNNLNIKLRHKLSKKKKRFFNNKDNCKILVFNKINFKIYNDLI